MLRKWILFSILGITLIFALAGCGSTAPKKIKVAVSLPSGNPTGQSMLKAIELALNEADGKAGDVSVELLAFNTSADEIPRPSPEKENEAVQKAIADPDVVAYIGPVTLTQAKISTPQLNKASIVQITPSAVWPGLTKPGYGAGEPGIFYPTGRQTLFRLIGDSVAQGEAAARWAKKLNFTKIYIIYDKEDYGKNLAGIFATAAKDVDLEIIDQKELDFFEATPEQIAEIAKAAVDANPDLIFLGGPGDGDIVNAVRSINPDIPIMGMDAFVFDTLLEEIDDQKTTNIYGVTSAPLSEFKTSATFIKNYKAAYDKDPVDLAGNSYEAMNVILQVIEKAQEPTREGVLAALGTFGEYSGVFGTWHFDEQGDMSPAKAGSFQVQDGAWKFVELIE